MSSSEFFKNAPVQETFQKRFLESIFHKQNVVGSFPLGFDAVSLYSFAAMAGDGMCVVVCPDRLMIRQRLAYFEQAGCRYPDVVVLDGTQMPHEEREVLSQINRHRVRVLFTLPERFASLTFLEMLLHAKVAFLLVEQAQLLLSDFAGASRYTRLWEGLDCLRMRPPLILLTQPLPPARLRELTERLGLGPGSYELFREAPRNDKAQVTVKCLLTEHQKFQMLVHVLSGRPEKGRQGRVDKPGSVLIHARDIAHGEKLVRALSRHGFDHVFPYHAKQDDEERLGIETLFRGKKHHIVVNCGYQGQRLQAPPGQDVRIIYWQPPSSLEEAFGQIFRQSAASQGDSEGIFLHTREDYEQLMGRLRSRWPDKALAEDLVLTRTDALKRYRRWVLSESCRVQTLVAYYRGAAQVDFPPCGRCDRCRAPRGLRGLGRQLSKHWLH